MRKGFFFLLLTVSYSLLAKEPYQATITVGSDSATVSDPNLVDLRRSLSSESIQELIPLYTPTSAVAININLRGLDAITSFAANSTALVVEIPRAGTSLVFDGGTRDNSISLFKDFIHDAGKNSDILRAYARYSPLDPIAGNPNSLLASMGQADYLAGTLSPLSGCGCEWSSQPIVHQFQVGMNVGRSFAGGYDTTSVTMPLRYSYSPDLSWALILDAPLTYNRNGGASSLYTSVGMGFRYPVTHDWSLTPMVRLGSGGSLDLCTSGNFFSAGLTSVYNFKACQHVFSMTNYAGYYTSVNLWLTGINFNYRLQDYVFKNGLAINSCEAFTLCNRSVNYRVSFIDTYYPSNRLYIRHYDEVGGFIVLNGVNPKLDYDCLVFGFTYQFGHKQFRSYLLNLIYQF